MKRNGKNRRSQQKPAMDERFAAIAATMMEEGRPLTLEALAREAGVSRSTAHRRTGGLAAVLKTLEARGINSDNQTIRGRLLTAARSLVATRGLIGATVESIAEHGNVSPVSVYRTFGDRETLLREALRDVFPLDVLAEIELEAYTLEQALMTISRGVIRFAGTYPGLMALMLLPASNERAEIMTVHKVQRDLRARVTALFEHHMATDAKPGDDALSRATAFLGLCLGASLLMHDISPLDEQDVEPRARLVVHRFLSTLGSPENGHTQTPRGIS